MGVCSSSTIFSHVTYRSYALQRMQRAECTYLQLPVAHQQLLPDYRLHLERCREAISKNCDFIMALISMSATVFENVETEKVIKPKFIELTVNILVFT